MTSEASQHLSPGEAALPPHCTSKPASSQAPGTEARSITVTLTSSCTAYAYTRASLTAQETAAFAQAVSGQFGSGYVLTGQLIEKVTDMRPPAANNTMATATVSVSEVCQYRFSGEEIATMQRLIAGKSQAQATVLLLKLRGVRTAGIQIKHGRTNLPGDVQRIAVTIQGVVVTNSNRLSRSLNHLAILVEEMEAYGVALHCLNDHADTLGTDRIVRLMVDFLADAKREKALDPLQTNRE